MSDIWTTCNHGNCSVSVNPITNKINCSFGPMECPCDLTPGWKSEYLDGQGKPRVKAKPIGRNGSRVQRSKQRHDKAYKFINSFASFMGELSKEDNDEEMESD